MYPRCCRPSAGNILGTLYHINILIMNVTPFRSSSVASTAMYKTSKEYQGRDGKNDDEDKEIIYFTSLAFR